MALPYVAAFRCARTAPHVPLCPRVPAAPGPLFARQRSELETLDICGARCAGRRLFFSVHQCIWVISMMSSEQNPSPCTAFLLAALVVACLCHTAWLALPASKHFSLPLDGGCTFRGRRLFGANKTMRGFLMMAPAAAASFALVAAFFT